MTAVDTAVDDRLHGVGIPRPRDDIGPSPACDDFRARRDGVEPLGPTEEMPEVTYATYDDVEGGRLAGVDMSPAAVYAARTTRPSNAT
jgi:hypothetical protein